jgi:hypothetical protein
MRTRERERERKRETEKERERERERKKKRESASPYHIWVWYIPLTRSQCMGDKGCPNHGYRSPHDRNDDHWGYAS